MKVLISIFFICQIFSFGETDTTKKEKLEIEISKKDNMSIEILIKKRDTRLEDNVINLSIEEKDKSEKNNELKKIKEN